MSECWWTRTAPVGMVNSARLLKECRLRKSRVFCPCLLEDRNVRVGTRPERKEIVVGASRPHGIARERERSRQLQPRHRVHGIDEYDASMIENPLELGGGFGGLTCREVRLAANVDRVQAAEASDEADSPKGEVVARGGLQRLDRRCRIVSVQREQGSKRRQVKESNRRILRELAREILGEGSRSRQITCEG